MINFNAQIVVRKVDDGLLVPPLDFPWQQMATERLFDIYSGTAAAGLGVGALPAAFVLA